MKTLEHILAGLITASTISAQANTYDAVPALVIDKVRLADDDFRLTYQDEVKVLNRQLIPQVRKTPKPSIIGLNSKGTEKRPEVNIYSPPQGHFLYAVIIDPVTTTSYTPDEEGLNAKGAPVTGKTSLGLYARGKEYFIAAAPKCIPYGAVVGIPGYGFKRVGDTGGDMRKACHEHRFHFDILESSLDAARNHSHNIKSPVPVYLPDSVKSFIHR